MKLCLWRRHRVTAYGNAAAHTRRPPSRLHVLVRGAPEATVCRALWSDERQATADLGSTAEVPNDPNIDGHASVRLVERGSLSLIDADSTCGHLIRAGNRSTRTIRVAIQVLGAPA